MGDEFVCPYCDHVDNISGECPDCGGTLTKLEDDPDDVAKESVDDLDLEPAESETADFDDFENSEPEYQEGGLKVI